MRTDMRMLTAWTVSKRYGVGEHTILRWIHSGELAAVNVARTRGAARSQWRISMGAISEFEATRAACEAGGHVSRAETSSAR